MAENKTLCIACKYKFHDRDLQPCADCLRSTQLAQQGIDRYQRYPPRPGELIVRIACTTARCTAAGF